MPDRDRLLGALLGAAVGDALGAPVDGLSHQNVRLYYRGIKGYRDDEKRGDVRAGEWTAHTGRLGALARALTAHPAAPDAARSAFDAALGARPLRRPEALGETTAEAAALGAAWALRGWTEEEAMAWVAALLAERAALTRAAAYGHAFAVRVALVSALEPEDGRLVLEDVAEEVRAAEATFGAAGRVSDQLHALAGHLDETPLDLQDRCGGTGTAADEAFPFAAAMFVRNPLLVEATLLSAVNVGGASSAVGALVGALLGARNGWTAFPGAWREGLDEAPRLEAEAGAFVDALRAPAEP
ncbi:MAG: ADP-ribosylglycohydrolase family protein [Rubricoccaceae bacterium]|nr:ADP-ribosylglycohydrolase family protein [Rubricoccaceae bacterium]